MTDNTVSIRLLEGEPAEMRELQRVLEEAPTYAHRVTGVPPSRADAQSTYTVLPEGKSYDDKFGDCLRWAKRYNRDVLRRLNS
jgi:hypothetical protein